MRVDAAAPLDGLEFFRVRKLGDLLRLFVRPVIAPEHVLVERLKLRIHGNHARSRGVQRQGHNLLSRRTGLSQHATCGCDERLHLFLMGLRGKVRIFAAAVQSVGCRRGPQAAAIAVQQRHPNTERSEIDSSNDRHVSRLVAVVNVSRLQQTY